MYESGLRTIKKTPQDVFFHLQFRKIIPNTHIAPISTMHFLSYFTSFNR